MTPCKHGNPNVLTPDIGTSKIAQGPAAHSCLVNFEKYHGSPYKLPRMSHQKLTELRLKIDASHHKFTQEILPQ